MADRARLESGFGGVKVFVDPRDGKRYYEAEAEKRYTDYSNKLRAEEQKKRAEELEADAKAAALKRFLVAGGTDADFEKQWPAIRRQQLIDAAAGRSTEGRLVPGRDYFAPKF